MQINFAAKISRNNNNLEEIIIYEKKRANELPTLVNYLVTKILPKIQGTEK